MKWIKSHWWEIIKIVLWGIFAILGLCFPRPSIPDLTLKLVSESISDVNEIYSLIPINQNEWIEKRIIYEPYSSDENRLFKIIKKREIIIIENKRNISAETIILSIELTPESSIFASIAFDDPDWENISDENQQGIKGFERELRNKIKLNIKEVIKEKRVILIWFLKKYEEKLNKFHIKVKAKYYSQGSHIGTIEKEDIVHINN